MWLLQPFYLLFCKKVKKKQPHKYGYSEIIYCDCVYQGEIKNSLFFYFAFQPQVDILISTDI